MKETKNGEIPQLWTSISHEIRTPLNVIKGMTDISENEIYDTELVRDCLNKIKESIDNMQRVVNSLVDYAAISQRNIEINNAKLDFKTLITEIAMRSYLMSKEKKCHFNMHVQDVTEEALIGDEARISQIIVALLNVVIRYTSSEGIIDFTVQQTGISNSKVFIRFCLKSTALQFPDEIVGYLNDNSLYMNPELLVPIGTFGLSEMNALYFSHLMGGKIQASNKPGDYSEIHFDMEFERIEQPYSLNGVKLFANQRILIVADTEEICNERGKMLVDMGMQYDIATESEETLDKIGEAESNNKPFSICIIDWDMQNQKCTHLIQDIRDIFGKDLTILATAHDPLHYQKEAVRYGANYVIDRTIFRSTLFDALVSIEKGIQIKYDTKKEEKYDFSGKRVLVAEDVALNMDVITKLLARVNVEITCVENGIEAVVQYEKKPAGYFDTVLLDINMPMLDGYETAKAIRNCNKAGSKTIPIYAMTANAFKEDVEKALDSGMDGHIAKPIDVNALYKILNKSLFANTKSNESIIDASQLEQENMQLRDLAEQDPLTGCLNRRGLAVRLKDIVNEATPIAYMIVDIDDFKHVNDRFGHETGDKILVKVVNQLKKKFRTNDCFVRFGGDEFAVILIDYKKNSSFLVKRIEEINEELMHPTDSLPPITVSVGVVISFEGYADDLYSLADKALYTSKKRGKGTCTIYEGDNEESYIEQPEDILYTEDIHYLDDQVKVIVDKSKKYNSQLMIKNKPVCYVTGFYDDALSIYSFNGFLVEQLGYELREFEIAATDGMFSFVHPDDRKHFMQIEEIETLYNQKIRLCNKSGDYIWYNVEYILTKTKEGSPFWMASLKNIDDLFVGSMCSEDYRMVAVINPEQDSMIIDKGAYLLSSKELHSQRKYNYSSLLSNEIVETVKDEERDSYLENTSLKRICNRLNRCGSYEFTVYQSFDKSDFCAVRHKFRYLSNRSDAILCTWEIIGQRAESDELTDSLNENGFYHTAEAIIKNSEKNIEYSVLYFNISGFKAWNSTLGKEGADKLLKLVVMEIERSDLMPLATGRLFSDHFACLIDRKNEVLSIVSSLCNSSFEVDEKSITLRMRCGIFHVDDTNESIRSMCDKAKLAKTFVKNQYAVPYYIFDKSLNEEYLQHMHVINNVGLALDKKEIKVYYQPIVDAKTQKIASAEALIRWILPGNLVLSPATFIPALEEQGKIADVDAYAHMTVGNMLERRYKNNQYIVPVSVNMSRMDFINNGFVEKLKNLVSTRTIATDYFRVEVTESAYIEVGQSGEALLQWLRNNNINILMDDFGTGVSTLSGLINQQFNIAKIDMSFIRDIGKKNGAQEVIKNVISMCHALNMKVVAEGVETEEQYSFLRDSDCDFIQGYYFYKPMPEAEFEELLNSKM